MLARWLTHEPLERKGLVVLAGHRLSADWQSGSLAGWYWGIYPVIALTVIQTVHYFFRDRYITAFPVQVRLGYLLLLVLGTYPPLGFIHWIQLFGTTAVVTVGYCPLARIMVLMPWNRSRPLTFALVWKTIVAPPVTGSVLTVLYGK